MMTAQVLRAPQLRTAFKSADFPGHSLPLENIGCFFLGDAKAIHPTFSSDRSNLALADRLVALD
jgi:hypothetical protein